MLEETLQLYTFCGMNVCAESHLSECRNGQTDGSDRRSIALRAASGNIVGPRSVRSQSNREQIIASLRAFNATAELNFPKCSF